MIAWYARRWWLAGGLFLTSLFCWYVFLLDDYLDQYKALEASIRQEQQIVLQLQKTVRQKSDAILAEKKTPLLLAQLQAHLQLYGLVLQSVQVTNRYTANVVIQGDRFQLVRWMREQAEHPAPFWVKHFNYQANRFEAQLVWIDGVEVPVTRSLPAIQSHESFCDTVSFAQEPAIPIRTMQLVGYIQRGDAARAILSLPTGQLISVGIGEAIGRERQIVQQIQPDRVRFASGEVIKQVNQS